MKPIYAPLDGLSTTSVFRDLKMSIKSFSNGKLVTKKKQHIIPLQTKIQFSKQMGSPPLPKHSRSGFLTKALSWVI